MQHLLNCRWPNWLSTCRWLQGRTALAIWVGRSGASWQFSSVNSLNAFWQDPDDPKGSFPPVVYICLRPRLEIEQVSVDAAPVSIPFPTSFARVAPVPRVYCVFISEVLRVDHLQHLDTYLPPLAAAERHLDNWNSAIALERHPGSKFACCHVAVGQTGR